MGRRQAVCAILLGGLVTITGCCGSDVCRSTAIAPYAVPAAEPLPVAPALPGVPLACPQDRPLPINLPTALQLANAQALDIAAAAKRVQAAAAALDQAEVLWLPTLTLGGDYFRHDGKIQDIQGNILDVSKSSLMFGVGTGIGAAGILNVGEAIFAPLAARQQLCARNADLHTAANDTLVAVSDAYFNVQQARGELAGACETVRRTEELFARTKKLAPGLVPELEVFRAETELARRQQAEALARERWKVASAELLRVLHIDPHAQVEPQEPPQLRIDMVCLDKSVDELIPVALTHRPELASQQAQVQATLNLLKQEKLRPLIPSILLRGASTPVTGTLAAGLFAGGRNSSIGNAGPREDIDLQVLWQVDNLGFGNAGRVRQREAEKELAVINLFRIQDRVAAEVVQAHAQAQQAACRVKLAEREVRAAIESADKNLVALGQTKTAGNLVILLVRPQEAVAAVQALAQAYGDYYTAVADANRAQFRLYRALGQPSEIPGHEHGPVLPPPDAPMLAPAPSEKMPEKIAAPR